MIGSYERGVRAVVERSVAEEWGVVAPYPSAKVFARFEIWRFYAEVGRGDWAVKNRKRAARMKVPAPYISWAHIAAFKAGYR